MFCPCFSLFSFVGRGKKVTAILRRSSSRGLCTPEVKIASVPVPAFTGNKMASSNLQIREDEQPPDRTEPAQLARERSLKQTKSKYKTREGGEASDVKKVLLHLDRINQFPGQHLSVLGNTMFCTACKEVVSSKNAFCHPIVPCHCVPEHITCDTNIVHFDTLSHRF